MLSSDAKRLSDTSQRHMMKELVKGEFDRLMRCFDGGAAIVSSAR